ncbi:MAG: hypothetical protein Tp166DCM644871_32 [Prokaryotic dsDNA virus sp.]|nr:MAG: hypothetical protein Tp166DCM644871_32 [Prokaryotic dsDNA virus sp.]QDP62632.1 MAG: hypothetical protein Tp166SUR375021_32 [Prokaryotic dsDNA virus sp.]
MSFLINYMINIKIKKDFILKNLNTESMNNSYQQARRKARQKRVEKRTEWINTNWEDKVKNSEVAVSLKSIKELAEEIQELIGDKNGI